MELSKETIALLEDIERRIDPETEEDFYARWKEFWYGRVDATVFRPKRKKTSESNIKLKNININDALHDFDLMLYRELATVSERLSRQSEALAIRANYGTGIISSLFGAEIFEMPKDMNTLPTTKAFNDSDKMRELASSGVPSLLGGFGAKVFAFGEMCAEILEKYPKIKKYVYIYHPDTQGPLDIAELMWGCDMFYEMYDDPDLVHSVFRTITDTYKSFLDKWYTVIPKRNELSAHWSVLHKGNIFLRLDSAVNLSTEFYDEFSKPYDKELFDHFGGGCIHFCGKGDHFIDSLCSIDNLHGVHMSQPHLNNVDKILNSTISNQKRLLMLSGADKHTNRPNMEKGSVHG